MINVTNGKLIRLLVDDEPFDVRYGELLRHERVLDFRAGTLTRRADWVSPGRAPGPGQLGPAGLAHPALDRARSATRSSRSTARSGWCVQSELVANEQLPPPGGDPRVAAALEAPLEPVEHGCQQTTGPG